MDKIDWSDLPEEVVDLIADRSSSNIELLRIRSICKPWRSAVAMKKRFQNRFQSNLSSLRKTKHTRLFPTTFFRVTLPSSSCSSKGWLIRTRQVSESSKNNLLSPLSRQLITTPPNQTLDLLKFAVSEFNQSYEIQYLKRPRNQLSSRVVFIDDLFFSVHQDNKIRCSKSGEESTKRWTRIKNQVKDFSDIILHRGDVYALDITGAIWWISLSQLSTVQYTPSTPLMDNYGTVSCTGKRLVEYCGDLCIVHRFRKSYIKRTIGFRVYKMDEDLAKWVEVSSLGDKALIVAVDSCFTVVASEYYGCLANSIYFTDNDDGDHTYGKGIELDDVKVFKLEDGSIIENDSSDSQSCFHMFSPPFL